MEEEGSSCDDAVEANCLRNRVLSSMDVDLAEAIYHRNDVLASASSDTYAEAEDEGNAGCHLCLSCRTMIEEDAIFLYAILRILLVAGAVALVRLKFSPL